MKIVQKCGPCGGELTIESDDWRSMVNEVAAWNDQQSICLHLRRMHCVQMFGIDADIDEMILLEDGFNGGNIIRRRSCSAEKQNRRCIHSRERRIGCYGELLNIGDVMTVE